MKIGLNWKTAAYLGLIPVCAVGITVGSVVYGQQDQSVTAPYHYVDIAKLKGDNAVWRKAPVANITLLAQPMALPRPKLALTEVIHVQAVHNRSWIAFRLNWKDTEKSEGGRLGKFSDAVAMEFPVRLDKGEPPSVFMGEVGKPVHIYHWRSQYQKDLEMGRHPTMKDLYPNMSIDSYPMEFPDPAAPKGTEAQRMSFSPGQAARNPQSFKKHGVDEIFAEGFGSSSVANSIEAQANGEWKNGEWTVVVVRPLKSTQGSVLEVGKKNFMGFAAWQGGQNEVGSRKCVTLGWVNLTLK